MYPNFQLTRIVPQNCCSARCALHPQGVYSMWVCVFLCVCACLCVGVFCQMTNVQFENVKEFCVDMLFENLLRLALHCQFTTAARHCCHTLAPHPPQSPSMEHMQRDICCGSLAGNASTEAQLPSRRWSSRCCAPCYCCLVIAAVANSLSLPPPSGWKGLSTWVACSPVDLLITA